MSPALIHSEKALSTVYALQIVQRVALRRLNMQAVPMGQSNGKPFRVSQAAEVYNEQPGN